MGGFSLTCSRHSASKFRLWRVVRGHRIGLSILDTVGTAPGTQAGTRRRNPIHSLIQKRGFDMSYTEVIKMVKIHCAECQILFGMTSDFSERRQEDHKNFYCPRGHHNYWPQESDIEKLKKEVAKAQEQYQRERIERIFHEKSARSYKGKVTQIKTRIVNGVCPCCNRSFKDVRRHMETKHPDFVNAKV